MPQPAIGTRTDPVEPVDGSAGGPMGGATQIPLAQQRQSPAPGAVPRPAPPGEPVSEARKTMPVSPGSGGEAVEHAMAGDPPVKTEVEPEVDDSRIRPAPDRPATPARSPGFVVGVFAAGFVAGAAFWWLASDRLVPSSEMAPTEAQTMAGPTPDRASEDEQEAPAESVAAGQEQAPVEEVASPSGEAADVAAAAPGPGLLAQGEFVAPEHADGVAGHARLVRTEAGATTLELRDMAVSEGPGLQVLIVRAARAGTLEEVLAADRLVLGPLKSASGDQDYDVPDTAALTDEASVVIWSRPFGLPFAVAPLAVAAGDQGGMMPAASEPETESSPQQ